MLNSRSKLRQFKDKMDIENLFYISYIWKKQSSIIWGGRNFCQLKRHFDYCSYLNSWRFYFKVYEIILYLLVFN